MKYIGIFFLIALVILTPGLSLAQNASGDLPTSVNQILNFLFLAAGILAFGMVVYGGIKYTLSARNIANQSDARDQIIQALVGLLLIISSTLILRTINPALNNLQLTKPSPISTTNPNSTCSEPCSTGKCVKGVCVVCSLQCDQNTGTSCAFNDEGSPYCAQCPPGIEAQCQKEGTVCKFQNNVARCEAKQCGDNNRFGPCPDPKEECVPFPGSSASDRLWGCVDKQTSSPS